MVRCQDCCKGAYDSQTKEVECTLPAMHFDLCPNLINNKIEHEGAREENDEDC